MTCISAAASAQPAGFEVQQTLTLGFAAYGSQTHVADVNQDGVPDLLIQTSPGPDSGYGYALWLLAGVPGMNGAFADPVHIPTATNQWWIAGVGDANGDGVNDLAYTSTEDIHSIEYFAHIDHNVTVPEDHTDSEHIHLTMYGYEFLDFDGDGSNELVYHASNLTGGSTWVQMMDYDATNDRYVERDIWSNYQQPEEYAFRQGAMGDFNADGLVDGVYFDRKNLTIRFLVQDSPTSMALSASMGMFFSLDDIAAADANGDDVTDFFVLQGDQILPYASTAPLAFETTPVVPFVQSSDGKLIARDVNNDGLVDLVTRDNNSIAVRIRRADDFYYPPYVIHVNHTVTDFSVGDVIGDAQAEVICSIDGTGPQPGGSAMVFSFSDPCPADLSDDGRVDSVDLAIMLAAWGGPDADLDASGVTDSSDLAVALASWGVCP